MKRLLVVCVLAVALLSIGVAPAVAAGDEYNYIVWKTGPYPGDYNNWFTRVGHLSVWDQGNGTIKATFVAHEGYELLETHLEVAPNLDAVPHNPGGPIPGRFDFGTEHSPAVTSATYYASIAGLPSNYIVVGHVVMRNIATGQVETGWVTDCNIAAWEYPGSNWARFVLMDGS